MIVLWLSVTLGAPALKIIAIIILQVSKSLHLTDSRNAAIMAMAFLAPF